MLLRAPHSRSVALLLAMLWPVPLTVPPARATSADAPSHVVGQDIEIAADQSIRLADTARAAPPAYGKFQRFGIYDSALITFPVAFNQVQLQYQRMMPAGGIARVDVRGLDVNEHWTEWQHNRASGDIIRFDARMRAIQYRIVLLTNSRVSPTIRHIMFKPAATRFAARAAKPASVAPTYRLRVTRQGLVGRRTANGHIIKRNDFFVSLPSSRALSSRGGNEYMVRLTARNGRSVVVPVWDNGPWNHHDDFWNKERERYRGLPEGWPQDHAAYYEKHNKGRSERGKVRYPSAVDIADGAYWALGLKGAQATVDVTFLWLGTDPGADARPLNTKPSERPKARAPRSQLIDTLPPVVVPLVPTPALTAPPVPVEPPAPLEPVVEIDDVDQPFTGEGSNWGVSVGTCGYGGQARSIATVTRDDSVTHQGIWRPALLGRSYELYAFVPACTGDRPPTDFARYIIHHAQGDSFVIRSQVETAGSWMSLGRFTFAAGSDGYVQLRNLGTSNTTIWFDAVKWVPVQP